jgi:hypothetical protein
LTIKIVLKTVPELLENEYKLLDDWSKVVR